MQISVCIITRNECEKLKKCLEAIKNFGFEIVVADTGSTDNTKEMVRAYTDRLYDFTWIDDFAAAKNYVISKASNDYVMIVDSDEYLRPEGMELLQKRIAEHPGEVGRIRRYSSVSRDGEIMEYRDDTSRVFDRRKFCFKGRIHEQVTAMDGSEFRMYDTGLVMDHEGYEGSEEERRQKSERNRKLLLKELELSPEDTYLLYQVGKSYYMSGDYRKAVEYFDVALGYDVNPGAEYVIDMVETYGYALLNCGLAENALALEGVYEEFGGSADFCFLMGLIYMNNGLFEEAVEQFMAAVKRGNAKAAGADSYLAYYNAGVIRECLGDVEQAADYYGRCKDYPRAMERLQNLQ